MPIWQVNGRKPFARLHPSESTLKKTHKLLLALLGVIVLMVVGFKVMQPKEPEYQGRKLSEWIADLGEGPPKNTEAEVVITQMQGVVLPFVEARLLQNEDPSVMPGAKRLLLGVKNRIVGRRHSMDYQWEVDFLALGLLRTNSIPVLKRLMLSEAYCGDAMKILAKLDQIEVLEPATKPNHKEFIRWNAVFALQDVPTRREAAAEIVIPLVHDDDSGIAIVAIGTLGALQQKPRIVVPLLCGLLDSKNSQVVFNAVYALERYGTNAMEALPKLQVLKNSPEPSVRNGAISAIQQINPIPPVVPTP